jgi:hypothetical protein
MHWGAQDGTNSLMLRAAAMAAKAGSANTRIGAIAIKVDVLGSRVFLSRQMSMCSCKVEQQRMLVTEFRWKNWEVTLFIDDVDYE